jgi:hypothetical protein
MWIETDLFSAYESYISWKISLKRPSYFLRIVFLVDMNYDNIRGLFGILGVKLTRGIFLVIAILNEECANPAMDFETESCKN